jgi:FkbM family methyltransferase
MKVIKLSLAALLTALAVSSYQLLLNSEHFYWSYRCWRQANNILSCYRNGNFDFSADFFGLRYEGNTGNYIDNRIFFHGAFEKPVLFLLRDIMSRGYSSQGVFVDVGANTGQHSLFMSRYASQIHAFEPYEPVLRRFRRMVEINHIGNVVIHPVGLGNENSKKPFYKPPENNLGTGSFVEGFKDDNSYLGELEIQIGDEALASARVTSVSIIKMDIEGYEKPALQGLRRTLTRNRPFVVFELTTDPTSSISVKSKEELKGLFPDGYQFFVIDESLGLDSGRYRLVNFDENVHFDKSEQTDILAYPTEKKEILVIDSARR